ncbi:MAG: ATP-dependent Clp protease ATP-binding subunit [Acidobacteria bacterium]|nr:ATP-dependent Clp protease ATP-binding subunit [Acidobacteriota bacterium]
MDYFIVFIAGVVSALLVIRARAGTTGRPEPSPTVRLQEIAGPLTAVGEASSHPRDLEANAIFREAVTILTSTGVPMSVVIDYASGAHFVLAAAAWAALCERTDRDAATTAMARQFQHVSPWPIYYALRFFTRVGERPPVGMLVLQVQDYWSEHPLVASMFAEHFAERIELGDTPGFGEALSATPAAKVTAPESLLGRIDHPTAKSLLAALAAWRRNALDRTYLQTVGRFIEDDPERQLVLEHEGIREQLAVAEGCISQELYRSVLVVGEPRSGKTSFLVALAARAAARGWSVFEAGAASIMAGQQYIGQLEERLQRLTTELAADKRVLWYVPDFLLLASSGRHQFQVASLLDQMLPAISAGRVIILSETTPAGLTTTIQNRPSLRGALELVRLQPMAEADIDRFTREFAARLTELTQIEIGAEVLDTATHLARHYLGASHMPGAAIDLLKRTAQRVAARDGVRMERSDVLDMLSQLTGMPPLVLDDRERLDLTALRAFFVARVIGQDEALGVVVDRIAMLKAGLIDPGRPIAVFLFAGPTGTGKTELAKTLADFIFGSAERLIRLDMSEFQTAESTKKIVGDADQHSDVQSLAHRVRKQRFSVVLLDEFEKAHPNTWDLFLQVFDDGRLTDAMGQTSDFRHCIIILTSNLGAKIAQGLGPGFGSTPAAFSQDQVIRMIHQTFRPEFVNRLDAVIVFRPLSRELMRGILTKELARVLDRRGLRAREWAVEWESSALDFLLDKGFSPAMGARPLKRAIDRHLLAPLAATLVEHRFPEGDQFLFVRSDGRGIQVEFDPDAPDDRTASETPEAVLDPRLTLPRMILQPMGTSEEQATVAAELRRLESRLAGERWLTIEGAIATDMQQQGFWEDPIAFGSCRGTRSSTGSRPPSIRQMGSKPACSDPRPAAGPPGI